MTFSEQLNHYIHHIGCSAKELSEVSGLSGATISRYRTGERIPDPNSEQLAKLAAALAALSMQKQTGGSADFSAPVILAVFRSSLSKNQVDFSRLSANFSHLTDLLGISMTELARALNFDASYLSRIRSGKRRPADPEAFVDSVCAYVLRRFSRPDDRMNLLRLIGNDTDTTAAAHTGDSSVSVIEATADTGSDAPASRTDSDAPTSRTGSDAPASRTDEDALRLRLKDWLLGAAPEIAASDPGASMEAFLEKLDQFDLDEYIRAIHFNDLKIPFVPFRLPTSRTYYGVESMKQGELDFFKSTVLSRSMDPVYMCSDMPMADMAADTDFAKKWMFAIAMTIKKGLHINIIHSIDRPFEEMMLGLESWIPLYMTGQISPFYLKDPQTKVYHHFLYTSGHAALSGECIDGYHDHGKYYLTNNREETAYYRRRSIDLFSRALPLMEIFRSENADAYETFLRLNHLTEGNRQNRLSSLPLYTMPEPLLASILARHQVSGEDQKRILAFAGTERRRMETILEKNPVLDEVPRLSPEEFRQYPMTLSLSGLFYETELPYTYEEYLAHLEAARAYASAHKNYSLRIGETHAFRNIQIRILEDKWVILSKNKAPVIHFVIRHPLMVSALENFAAPVVEL